MSGAPLLQRTPGPARPALGFSLDGRPCTGLDGDTVLTAVLSQGALVRRSDASGAARAGFCFMGACQDCWMWLEDGRRLRACSEPLQDGMRLLTRPRP